MCQIAQYSSKSPSSSLPLIYPECPGGTYAPSSICYLRGANIAAAIFLQISNTVVFAKIRITNPSRRRTRLREMFAALHNFVAQNISMRGEGGPLRPAASSARNCGGGDGGRYADLMPIGKETAPMHTGAKAYVENSPRFSRAKNLF